MYLRPRSELLTALAGYDFGKDFERYIGNFRGGHGGAPVRARFVDGAPDPLADPSVDADLWRGKLLRDVLSPSKSL